MLGATSSRVGFFWRGCKGVMGEAVLPILSRPRLPKLKLSPMALTSFAFSGVTCCDTEECGRFVGPCFSSMPCDIQTLDWPDSDLASYFCHF